MLKVQNSDLSWLMVMSGGPEHNIDKKEARRIPCLVVNYNYKLKQVLQVNDEKIIDKPHCIWVR
jgi:hypothetical protein